jgi:hypothetical protein
VKVPTSKGKHLKALLIFSDKNETIEVRESKGNTVTIPYRQIEKCSYQYTTELTIGLTHAKNHWLEIDYRDQNTEKQFVLQMDKHDYIRILDAMKTHAGIDAQVLGNADKRRGSGWNR